MGRGPSGEPKGARVTDTVWAAPPFPAVAPAAVDAPVGAGARGTAARLAAAAAGTLFLGLLRVHRPPGLATLCLLRATTGLPCPLCGTTTAAVRLGRGNVLGALAANPVTVVLGAVLVLAPALRHRVHVPPRTVPWLLTGAAVFAWTWQLARFDRWPF
jgi:hypothetical protein